MSDAIVLTSKQPGEPRHAPRSSAPRAGGAGRDAAGPIETLVPAGFAFEGTVAFDGRARIDGRVIGRVDGRGRLEVGATGELHGDVRADEIVLAGAVEGDLEATGRLEMREGARVRGAVRTRALRMNEGALLDGPCAVAGPPDAGAEDPDSGTATDGCAG